MKKLILFLLIVNVGLTHAHTNEKYGETRTATVTLKVDENDIIDIKSNNTDLLIEAHNKNEVIVTATIRYDGELNNKLNAFLDEFQAEVEKGIAFDGNELKINTNLDEPNKFQIGSKHVGIQIGFNEKELSIHYKIQLPSKNKIVIKNTYKDLRLIGNYQDIEIDQYSGNLKAEDIVKADLKLKYGSATFKNIEEAEMNIYEQKIDANKINYLKLEAKYSDLEINEIDALDANSYESDYSLGNVGKLEGEYKYGELEISQNLENAELEMYETDIEANTIGKIFMISKYGSIEADHIGFLNAETTYEDEIECKVLGNFTTSNSKYGKYNIGLLKDGFEIVGYEDEIEISSIASSAKKIKVDGKYIDLKIDVSNIAFEIYSKSKYGNLDFDKSQLQVSRLIKENDELEIQGTSSIAKKGDVLSISIKGYEIKTKLE